MRLRGTHGSRRVLVAASFAASVAVVATSPAGPTTGLVGAADARASITVAPAAPVAGETVHVSGSVGARGSRTVVVQSRRGSRWAGIARVRTSPRGTYSLRLPAPATGVRLTLRIVASSAAARGGRRAVTRTRAVTVRVVGQRGAVSVPSAIRSGEAVAVVARFTPARARRPVIVQVATGRGWATRARALQSPRGEVRVTLTGLGPGSHRVRAVALRHRGARSAATPAARVTVAAPGGETVRTPDLLSPGRVAAMPMDSAVTVTWTRGGGADLAAHRVLRAPEPAGPWTEVASLPADVTSTTVRGLANGTPYWFQVRAASAAGEVAEARVTAAATPVSVPTAPVTVSEGTRVVEGGQVSAASVDADGRTVVTMETRPLQVGDTLVVEPSAVMPEGMFARVARTEDAGGGAVRAVLEQAPIDDVFDDARIDFDTRVTPQPITDEPGTGVSRTLTGDGVRVRAMVDMSHRPFTCERSGVPVSLEDVWEQGNPIPLTFTISNVDAEWRYDEAARRLRVAVDYDWTVGFEAKFALAGVSCETNPSWARRNRIFHGVIGHIGAVPIVLDIEPKFSFEVSAGGHVSLTRTSRFTFWVEKTEDRPIAFGRDVTGGRPELTKGKDVGATAFGGVHVAVQGGGGRGSANAKAGLYLDGGLQLSLAPEPGCTDVDLSFRAAFGLQLELWSSRWNQELANFTLASLAHRTFCFGAPPLNTTVPRATAGIYYDTRLTTADGRRGPWALVSGSLPAGLTFDAAGGRIFGTPASPGATTVQVRFTDRSGQQVEAPITLNVAPAPANIAALIGRIARQDDGRAWYVDLRGGRHHIPDGGTFECLQAQGLEVRRAFASEVEGFPELEPAECVRAETGDVIRHPDGDAYLLNADGTRSWIADADTYECLAANGRRVVRAPRYHIMDLREGPRARFDCADQVAVRRHVVRATDGTSWYVDGRGDRHHIPDGGVFECLVAQGRSIHPYVVPARLISRFGTRWEDAQCVRAQPGDIIRHPDGDAYLVNGDRSRSWIPDGGSFLCLSVNGHPVVNGVPRYHIDDLTRSPADATMSCYDAAAVNGRVVRASDGTSYYVDRRGTKHWIPNGGTFECIQAQTGAWPHVVPREWLTQQEAEHAQCVRAQPGNIVRHRDGDAYLVNGDWTRGWIPTASSYQCFRASGRAVVDGVPRYWIMDLRQVGNAVYGPGTCIVRRSNGAAFYVNNEGRREWIPDAPTWDCEAGRGIPVINAPDALVDGIAEVGWHYCLNPANLHRKMLRHSDGDVHYVHPDNTRTWVPDGFTYGCRVRAGVPLVETRWREYVNAFRNTGWDYCFDINTFRGQYIRHPDGDRHFVGDDGVRHWVPADRAACMDARFGAPATVRWRQYVTAIPEREWAICGDTLYRNQLMDRGQWLASANGYRLVMQTDGNLVIYNRSARPIWAVGVSGAARHLKLHNDGCLARVNTDGQWSWQVGCGRGGDRLVMQGDGNLVLYAGATPIWWSNTVGR